MITREEFIKKTGHEPVQDDLDRVNCEHAGEPLHTQCGWCEAHDRPRFNCGCRLESKNPYSEYEDEDLLPHVEWDLRAAQEAERRLLPEIVRDADERVRLRLKVEARGTATARVIADRIAELQRDGNVGQVYMSALVFQINKVAQDVENGHTTNGGYADWMCFLHSAMTQ